MEIRVKGVPRGDEGLLRGFKADAVALYLSDTAQTYASVAKNLGMSFPWR
jgi:hypothetical protein